MAKVNNKKAALGAGLALAAAAAAGAGYFFYGSKNAARNRKKAGGWTGKMKADVVKKAKTLKKLDEKAYKAIVEESMRAYQKVKSIDSKDLRAAGAELKSSFVHIQKELGRVAKKDVKVVKKAAKGAVRKATKAVTKALPKKPVKKVSKKRKA